MKRNPIFERILTNTSTEVRMEVDFSFQISEKISEILSQKKITQRVFAEMMCKSEAEISRWLQGTHNFTLKTIFAIQKVLGEEIISISKIKQTSQQPILLSIKSDALDPFTLSSQSSPTYYFNHPSRKYKLYGKSRTEIGKCIPN